MASPAMEDCHDPLIAQRFRRRCDGFAHALAGGLWAAPLLHLSNPRLGTQLYGKVVSTDREKLIRWAAQHGLPPQALQRRDLPDLEARRWGLRRRVEAYHIDLWGERLRWAYHPGELNRP